MDDDALRKEKLSKLLEIEGYESVEDLIEAVLSDAVSPAICMNETAPSRARWSRIRTPATARSASPTRGKRRPFSPTLSSGDRS